MILRLLLLIFLASCNTQTASKFSKPSFSSTGIAYIYNVEDFKKKTISRKLRNDSFLVAHNNLRPGTLLSIKNPVENITIIAKITTRIKFPDFYNVLITQSVAKKLNLDPLIPYVEIQEIKKNKSFIASKAETYNEERKVFSNAPVSGVKIDNISKNKAIKKINKKNFIIIIAEFYSKESAIILRTKLLNKMINLDKKTIKIIKKKKNSFMLQSGPHKSLNELKDNYTILKNYGFEYLDVKIYE